MTLSTYDKMCNDIQISMERYPTNLRGLSVQDITLIYAKALSRTQKQYDQDNLDHHLKTEKG